MEWIKYKARVDGDKGTKRKPLAKPRYKKGDVFVMLAYGSVVSLAAKGSGKTGLVGVFNSQFCADFEPAGAITTVNDLMEWFRGD